MTSISLRTPVVIDVGTGTTKLGFGGNLDVSCSFPTATAVPAGQGNDALSCFITGPSAEQRTSRYDVVYPLQRRFVQDWEEYEKLIFGCLCDKLQVNTREHPVLITEPPLNAPRNRECVAELMFETFQVPALHIGLQPLLALYGTQALNTMDTTGNAHQVNLDNVAEAISVSEADLTGVVVDIGEGATHCVPIISGYVVESAIRSAPLAGADITAYIQASLRERGQPLPAEGALELCRHIKHTYTYACKNLRQAYEALHRDPASIVVRVPVPASPGSPPTSGAAEVEVTHERFSAPEVFFDPSIAKLDVPPLQQLVDDAVQGCSIDSRRKLYANICLSGGSSMFKNFGRKLRMEVQRLVDARLGVNSKAVPVTVTRHRGREISVWTGGSLMSVSPDFLSNCHTREAYAEYGPSICWSDNVLPIAIDFPAALFWERLFQAHDDALVILTVWGGEADDYGFDKWYQSVNRTVGTKRIRSDRDKPWHDMVWGPDGLFKGRFDDREATRHIWLDRIAHVKKTVPPRRLLVFDVREGWGPLCAFLGMDEPRVPFPTENAREEFWHNVRGKTG